MKGRLIFCFLLASLLLSCAVDKEAHIYVSDHLQIQQINENVFIHVSYLELSNGNNFPCNGMVYILNGEALVFDTPTNDVAAGQLIQWIEEEKKAQINHVVVNHYHVDCLGSLDLFHSRGIDSYGLEKTIALARKDSVIPPRKAINSVLISKIKGGMAISEFLGEAHSKDNLITYLPDEKIMFGGCAVKAVGASKGNLSDANVEEWPKTMQKVIDKYSNVDWVIPGHGDYGGPELLEYTKALFTKPE